MGDIETTGVESVAAHEPLLPPRFEGEPLASVTARTDAMVTVRFLKRHGGGSEASLFAQMRRTALTPPSTSTTGQWARGEVPSQKDTNTAHAYDAFGRGLPGYPPTGRTLQAIVRDVASAPGSGADELAGARHADVATRQEGQTVLIDARVQLPPGERLDNAVVSGQRLMSPEGKPQVTITIVVTTLAVLLIIGVVAFLHSARGSGAVDRPAGVPSERTARPTPTRAVVEAPAGVGVQATLVLDRQNFCSWRLGTQPIPLVSLSPVTMRIDARCNYPANPNPRKDSGATVYSKPTNNNPDLALGHLGDGNAFVAQCWVRADRVSDSSSPANVSRIWIRTDSPSGYVPDVNVGGGYTATQLAALGLPQC